MKWLYLGGIAGYMVLAFVGTLLNAALQSGSHGSEPPIAGIVVTGIGALGLLVVPVAAMVWLYKSWACIPPDMRYTDGGKWVTPGAAVGYLFIPFYNLYWIFVANMGLCEAINRALVQRGGQPRAPRGLAIAACIVYFVPYCNMLAGPILWIVFMFMVDSAKRELVNRTGAVAY